MEKICKGIQHIVVVKGLDRYVTELSQWWKYIYTNERGEKTEYRCCFASDDESVSPAEYSYEETNYWKTTLNGEDFFLEEDPALYIWTYHAETNKWECGSLAFPFDPTLVEWRMFHEWLPLSPTSLDDETETSTDSARTIAPVTDIVEYEGYDECSFPFNPCAVKWTPYIKKEEGDEREYRCVLKNEDSDTFKVEDVDSSYVIGDNEEYYVSFKFSPSDTGDLKVGKVSMSVIDSDNTLIYYKKHYAKVFETILYEEDT